MFPKVTFPGVSGHPCPQRHLVPLGAVSGAEPVCLHFLLGIQAWLRRHSVLLWRLGHVLLSCKIMAEEISCVGGKPRGHRIVSIIQSQILPWVCIKLNSCLQSQAPCFPKMSCFLFYFNRGLEHFQIHCSAVPAGSSQLRPVAGVWRHLKAGHAPELPLTHHCSGDGPQLQRVPEDSSCQFYSLVFMKAHWGERVRGKRERKVRGASKIREQYPQTVWSIKWFVPWHFFPKFER